APEQAFFAGVPDGHFFQRSFVSSNGLPIAQFVKLALGLICRFLEQPGYSISRCYFAPLETDISPEHIDAFLTAISVDIDDLPPLLR
ncbi:MAG: hypothetical protein ACKVIS_21105, partial [Pseudomonadales bacterium]